MTNAFYTKTFDVTPGNRVGSQTIEDQYLLVQQGFDGVETAINAKAPLASPTFTGNPVLPATTVIGTVNAAEIVTLSGVTSPIQTQLNAEAATRLAADNLKANIASPALTGTPTAPTATAGTDTTQIATTAFTKALVTATAFTSALPNQAGNSGLWITTDGTNAHWAALTGVVTPTGAETLTNKKISAYYIVDRTTTNAAVTGSVNLDVSTATVFDLTLSGNATLAVTNAPTLSGETLTFVVKVTQPGTAYTLTWSFGTLTWLTTGGTAPAAPALSKTIEYIFTTSAAGVYVGRKGAST